MLGAIGDLVEDVVVHLHESVNVASDTAALIVHRRGGSAANVIAAACLAGGSARFIGQVGDDATGRSLTDALAATGAEVMVRRAGRSGTVIAMLDVAGERTMLSDRSACTELADPDSAWLDGLHTLHIPFYSLVGEPLATTATTLARWAVERNIAISIDTSSSAVLEQFGATAAIDIIRALRPTVVLANELEAATLGAALHPDNLDGALLVIKQGALPALVVQSGQPTREVAANAIGKVTDTTGAGDAFAAGFLLAYATDGDPIAAAQHGHQVAAAAIQRASA
ncbi:MAG: sugar kinase [Actinomycetia bacterium]|nr:sugar kinase [Actinomycetes bacterium]